MGSCGSGDNYHQSCGSGDNYHHSRRGGDNYYHNCGGGDNYYHNCGSSDNYYHNNCGGDYHHDYYNDPCYLIEHSTELKQTFVYKAGSNDFQLFCTTSISFSCTRIFLDWTPDPT